MKLTATTKDGDFVVEIFRNGSEVTATIDGRAYKLDVSEPQPGVYTVREGSTISEFGITRLPDGTYTVSDKNASLDVSIADPKRLRGSGLTSDSSSGRAEIKAAMPGKIVRILKAEGDSIEKGEGIIVVEAMKMQNEMRSPKAGTVSQILPAEGDTVAAGDVLVTIE